uniref:AP-5 complex subunit mu-1 n=1 Tax=Leptobrachium leishanense TaxID=445787 RepID=A0A8C5QRV3_9ANUR
MPLRAVWIFSHGREQPSAVKFSRRFPTVEKRAKAFNRASHVSIPDNHEVLKALLLELGLTQENKNFVEYRDGCSRIRKTHVHALNVPDGKLWPVLAMQSADFIYACLPLVEQQLEPPPSLISISSISEAFSLLSGAMTFIHSGQNPEADVPSRLSHLASLLTQACPLGSPLDSNLIGLHEVVNSSAGNQAQKAPAWRFNRQKGKSQIDVHITEKVTCAQYDEGHDSDTWQVYGTVSCKCNLDAITASVTVGLHLPANGSPLQDILVHPCVTSVDSSLLISSSVAITDDSASNGPYKLPFTPPLEPFNLCHYTSQVPVPPILGCYQMTEDGCNVQISVKLKLHESVRNGFDHCEAHIPFFNKGHIKHFEYKVSHGQMEMSREKSRLVWVIGQKFPKSLEMVLSGTVTFSSDRLSSGPTDAVCGGNTAYVKLSFRIPEFTLTGCYTDQYSVQNFSTAKPKILTSRELASSDYLIWNSKAPAPVLSRSLFQ